MKFVKVYLERHSEGNADGQVGKDPQEPVGQWPLEAEPMVVSNLVDGQHQGVVDHSAEAVGSQHYHRPRTVLKSGIAEDLIELNYHNRQVLKEEA